MFDIRKSRFATRGSPAPTQWDLVHNFYNQAFPPLRAYYTDGSRPNSNHLNAPRMDWMTQAAVGDTYRPGRYSFAWVYPEHDPATYLSFPSMYWQDQATMISLQSIAGGTWGYYEQYETSGVFGAHLVTDTNLGGTAGYPPVITPDSSLVQDFNTFLPGAAGYELHIRGILIPDTSGDANAFTFFVGGAYANIHIEIHDDLSNEGYYWDGSEWVTAGKFFTAATFDYPVGPGFFEIVIPLGSLTRGNINSYVDASLTDPYQVPSHVPAFTPPGDLGGYDWPANDGGSPPLTRVGNFDPTRIMRLLIDQQPINVPFGTTPGIKCQLETVTFRPATGLSGIIYTEDYYVYNNPAPLEVQLPLPTFPEFQFGEGYILNIDLETVKANRYVSATNRWSSQSSYPFTMYAQFTYRGDGAVGGIGGVSGPSGDTSWAASLRVQGGYPQLRLNNPNFDGASCPSLDDSNVLWTGEAGIMDAIPSGIAARYNDANWQLKVGNTYEVAVVLNDGNLVDTDPFGTPREDIKLYVIDTNDSGVRSAFLVGWVNPAAQNPAGVTAPALTHTLFDGVAPSVGFGVELYRGAADETFNGDIIEFRIYGDMGLTVFELGEIVPNTTDATSANLSASWRFPLATPSWQAAFDPNLSTSTVFPSVQGNVLDEATVAATVPVFNYEIRDPLSVDFANKLTGTVAVPLGTTTTLAIDFSNSATFNGRLLDTTQITAIFGSVSNGPSDAIVVHKMWFQQSQVVDVYEPGVALPYTKTEASDLSLPDLRSLYYRFKNTGTDAGITGDFIARITVWDDFRVSGVLSDPFQVSVTYPLPAPDGLVHDEQIVSEMISIGGRVLDATKIAQYEIEVTSQPLGSSIDLNRSDFRTSSNIFINVPLASASPSYDRVWTTPPLDLAGRNLEFLIQGTNVGTETGTLDFRIDDVTTTAAINAGLGNFFYRHDSTFDLPPGGFVRKLQVDGVQVNRGPNVRTMDMSQITRLNLSGPPGLNVTLFRALPGFQFKESKAYHFGSFFNPGPTGFTEVSAGDGDITYLPGINGQYTWFNGTLKKYSTSDVAWETSTDLVMTGFFDANTIASRALSQDSDSLGWTAAEQVGSVTFTGLTAGASYHMMAWTEFDGYFQNVPIYLRRTLTANGVTLEDVTLTTTDWYDDYLLRGQNIEADFVAADVNPYDLFGQYHAHPVESESGTPVVADGSGNITLAYTNSDSIWATELAAVIIEPNTSRSDTGAFLAQRKIDFNNNWTLVSTNTPWPTATNVELVEVHMAATIIEPDDFISLLASPHALEHVVVPGTFEHLLFIALSGSDDASPTITVTGLPGGFTVKQRHGQWAYARSGSLLSPNGGYLRADNDPDIKANLPRAIQLQVSVPGGTAAGTHSGTISISTGGHTASCTFVLTVVAVALPAHDKPVGQYYLGSYRYQFGDKSYTTLGSLSDWTDWQTSLADDYTSMAEQGSTMLSLTPQFPTSEAADSWHSGFTDNTSRFLYDCAQYKAAGYGTKPWSLYQTLQNARTNSGLTTSLISGGADTGNVIFVQGAAPSNGYMNGGGGTVNLMILHDAYRAAVGVTDPTVSIYNESTLDFSLTSSLLSMSVNGGPWRGWSDNIVNGGSFFRYNADQYFYINTATDGGQDIIAGDVITLRYNMNDFSVIIQDGRDIMQHKKWLHNRLVHDHRIFTDPLAAAITTMLADGTGTYPSVAPYIAVADEPKVNADSTSGYGGYTPTLEIEMALAAADACHQSGLTTIGATNDALDITAFSGFLDAFQINDGWAGLSASTVATVEAAGIHCFMYNLGKLRLTCGFYLWRAGYRGFIDFAATTNGNVRFFDPTDGNEGDAPLIYPTSELSPAVSNIDVSLADQARGVIDYRWCLWLDAQVTAGTAGAAAVKSSVQAAISPVWSVVQQLTSAQLDAARKLITDFAQSL